MATVAARHLTPMSSPTVVLDLADRRVRELELQKICAQAWRPLALDTPPARV
jgi:hypothetical protein